MSIAQVTGGRVFVDTGAFGAIVNPDDLRHRAAQLIARALEAGSVAMITSNFVLAEAHALVLRRADRRTALRVIQLIDDSSEVVRIEVADEQRARETLVRYDDKKFSYVDATSFAVMERLGLTAAFTFDRHFAQYGFQVHFNGIGGSLGGS